MAPQVTVRPLRLTPLLSPPSTMRLYLLLHVAILGIVDSQTANRTDEEPIKAEQPGNQTLPLPTSHEITGGVKVGNVSSTLYKDELSELEREVGLQHNATFTLITEDDERFQDQGQFRPPLPCDGEFLTAASHSHCGEKFHQAMMTVSTENWCDLEYTIRPYNHMIVCMEELSGFLGCYYPNPEVQDFFLYIHHLYFHNCSEAELLLADAPHAVVVVLTLIPVSLIPLLVFLVVWKSKVRE
ncbi:receptor activity-modifying protein 3 [Genypterus blacodes]|uniref:receptor activity-modifying protein 3 n=1 Tax=Genypterus blacodes TaxID=154954 RepID=UPI003F769EB5